MRWRATGGILAAQMKPSLVVVAMALVGCGRVGITLRGDDDRDGGVGDDAADGDAVTGDAVNEGPLIGDAGGFWELVEGRILGEGRVRSSSDLQNGIRGNALVAEGKLHLRFLALAAGAQPEIGAGTSDLSIEGTRWVASDGITTAVSTVRWSGPDEVTITWDPGDPDTKGTPYLDMIRLVRAAAPPASLPGAKTVTRIAYQDLTEFATGSCAPNLDGESQIVVGSIEISNLLLFDTDFTYRFFGTPDCTGGEDLVTEVGKGYLEVDGASFRLWLSVVTYAPVAMSGTIAISDASIRLTRDACEPAASAECADFVIAVETTP